MATPELTKKENIITLPSRVNKADAWLVNILSTAQGKKAEVINDIATASKEAEFTADMKTEMLGVLNKLDAVIAALS